MANKRKQADSGIHEESRENRCGFCGRSFMRRWNLHRHVQTRHPDGGGNTFVVYVPVRIGSQARFPLLIGQGPAATGPSASPQLAVPYSTLSAPALLSDAAATPLTTPPGASSTSVVANTPEANPTITEADLEFATPPGRRAHPGVRRDQAMPQYSIRLSGDQPRAASWLTRRAKEHLEARVRALTTAWGFGPRHAGTCVLVPADWAAMEPLAVMEDFVVAGCPGASATRMVRLP